MITRFQVDYNENEDEYFLSILTAIKKKLSIAQLKINVPVESPETAIEVNVGVKHRLASKRGALKETNLAS